MMTDMTVHSDLPIPPGEYLEEVLDELGMTKDELARRMDRPASKLSAIFKGRKAITPDTALQLEKVVGVPAHIWTGLESEYRLALARREEEKEVEQLQAEKHYITRFCYTELAKIGAVPKHTRAVDKVRALQNFFGVTSLMNVGSLRQYQAAFRCGGLKQERSPEAVAAWLRLGERRAREIECAPFDKKRLEDALPEIRSITSHPPDVFIPLLSGLLADAGVALVIGPHLPKTYAHGATFPLGRRKAVVMLTIRRRWADIFWFSLFHEIGHILLHDRNAVFVEYDDKDPAIQTQEDEANAFAAETLIPSEELKAFIDEGSYYQNNIRKFARHIGIDEGIVVGRLQHEGILRPEWRNKLRSRYEWKER